MAELRHGRGVQAAHQHSRALAPAGTVPTHVERQKGRPSPNEGCHLWKEPEAAGTGIFNHTRAPEPLQNGHQTQAEQGVQVPLVDPILIVLAQAGYSFGELSTPYDAGQVLHCT